MTSTTTNTKSVKKPRRMAREPKPITADGVGVTQGNGAKPTLPALSLEQASQPPSMSKPQKPTSKASGVLEMLQRPAGATLAEMVAATGWLPHTTRAVLTGFKKKGHAVTSDTADGVRTYRIAPAPAEPTPPARAQPRADP